VKDTVFSFGELAYQEFETSKYLTAVLEKNGFRSSRHRPASDRLVAAGSGHPIIALGSDIDCLRRPTRSPASPIATRSSRARPVMARATIPDRRSTSSPRSRSRS